MSLTAPRGLRERASDKKGWDFSTSTSQAAFRTRNSTRAEGNTVASRRLDGLNDDHVNDDTKTVQTGQLTNGHHNSVPRIAGGRRSRLLERSRPSTTPSAEDAISARHPPHADLSEGPHHEETFMLRSPSVKRLPNRVTPAAEWNEDQVEESLLRLRPEGTKRSISSTSHRLRPAALHTHEDEGRKSVLLDAVGKDQMGETEGGESKLIDHMKFEIYRVIGPDLQIYHHREGLELEGSRNTRFVSIHPVTRRRMGGMKLLVSLVKRISDWILHGTESRDRPVQLTQTEDRMYQTLRALMVYCPVAIFIMIFSVLKLLFKLLTVVYRRRRLRSKAGDREHQHAIHRNSLLGPHPQQPVRRSVITAQPQQPTSQAATLEDGHSMFSLFDDDAMEELTSPFAWHPLQPGVFAMGSHHSNSVLLSASPVDLHPHQQNRSGLENSVSSGHDSRRPPHGLHPVRHVPDALSGTIRTVSARNSKAYSHHKNLITTELTKRASHIVCLAFSHASHSDGYRLAVGTSISLEMWVYRKEEEKKEESRMTTRVLPGTNPLKRETSICRESIADGYGFFEQEIVEMDSCLPHAPPVTSLAWSREGETYLIVAVYSGSVLVLQREFRLNEDLAVWFCVQIVKLPKLSFPFVQRSSQSRRYIENIEVPPMLPKVSMLSNGGDVLLVDSTNWKSQRWRLQRKRGTKLIRKIGWFPNKVGWASFIVGTTYQLWQFRFAVGPTYNNGMDEDRTTSPVQIFPLHFDMPCRGLNEKFGGNLQDFAVEPIHGAHIALLLQEFHSVLIYRIRCSSLKDPVPVFETPLVVSTCPTSLVPLGIQFAPSATCYSEGITKHRAASYEDATPIAHLPPSALYEDQRTIRRRQQGWTLTGTKEAENDTLSRMKLGRARDDTEDKQLSALTDLHLSVIYSSSYILPQVQLLVTSDSSTVQKLAKREIRIFQVGS